MNDTNDTECKHCGLATAAQAVDGLVDVIVGDQYETRPACSLCPDCGLAMCIHDDGDCDYARAVEHSIAHPSDEPHTLALAPDLEPSAIVRGMRVTFKPEFREPGDEAYTYVVVEDADPVDGSFCYSAVETDYFIRPRHPARAHMVATAVPFLPIVSVRFLGVDRKGVNVEETLTLGDRTLESRVERMTRTRFRAIWQRAATACVAQQRLGSYVAFPATKKEIK